MGLVTEKLESLISRKQVAPVCDYQTANPSFLLLNITQ